MDTKLVIDHIHGAIAHAACPYGMENRRAYLGRRFVQLFFSL